MYCYFTAAKAAAEAESLRSQPTVVETVTTIVVVEPTRRAVLGERIHEITRDGQAVDDQLCVDLLVLRLTNLEEGRYRATPFVMHYVCM